MTVLLNIPFRAFQFGEAFALLTASFGRVAAFTTKMRQAVFTVFVPVKKLDGQRVSRPAFKASARGTVLRGHFALSSKQFQSANLPMILALSDANVNANGI